MVLLSLLHARELISVPFRGYPPAPLRPYLKLTYTLPICLSLLFSSIHYCHLVVTAVALPDQRSSHPEPDWPLVSIKNTWDSLNDAITTLPISSPVQPQLLQPRQGR